MVAVIFVLELVIFTVLRIVRFKYYFRSIEIVAIGVAISENYLCTNVDIDYIKPFSNSSIGDEVIIAVDKTKKLSLTSYLDKCEHGYAATVKIFTEIKTMAIKN